MAVVDAASILAWFAHHRRSFPWRGPFPRDPYLVLLSEMMLQQTQASRVAARFPGFLARFPTVEALAHSSEEDVIAAFSGLGYYRRARQLHQLARQVTAKGWPQDARTLAELPGLGGYTSAAVAAFAFGQMEPPVDANLCRIAARLLALDHPVGSARLAQAAKSLASELATEAGTVEVFEALMELGALICTPRKPLCSSCPLRPRCLAAQGNPAVFPVPRPPRAREYPSWVVLWVENAAGQVLLQRLPDPPLAGLWLPPLDRTKGNVEDRAENLARKLALPTTIAPAGTVRHHITHRTITVHVFSLPAPWAVREERRDLRWASPQEGLPTSSLFHKLTHLRKQAEDKHGRT